MRAMPWKHVCPSCGGQKTRRARTCWTCTHPERVALRAAGIGRNGYDACPRCGRSKAVRSKLCEECRYCPDVVFWPKVDRSGGPESCWPWLGGTDRRGYGAAQYAGQLRAHQAAYVVTVGPVPKGLELDHLCRRPICVNPAHLEPVTHQENMRRSGLFQRKPTCRRGHPRGDDRSRQCGECERMRRARRRRIATTEMVAA